MLVAVVAIVKSTPAVVAEASTVLRDAPNAPVIVNLVSPVIVSDLAWVDVKAAITDLAAPLFRVIASIARFEIVPV